MSPFTGSSGTTSAPVLPKRKTKKLEEQPEWIPPKELEGALQSLYRSYERRFQHWEKELAPLGETAARA